MSAVVSTHMGTMGAFRNANGKGSTTDELNHNDQGWGLASLFKSYTADSNVQSEVRITVFEPNKKAEDGVE